MPPTAAPGSSRPNPPLPSGAVAGVLFLTSIFLLSFLSRMVLSPLFPTLELEMGFSHSQAGAIFMLGSMGYCCGLFFSGWTASKLYHFGTVLLALFFVFVACVLMATATSLNALCFSSILAGLAAGLYLPSGVASVTGLVPRQRYGWALGMHEWAPNSTYMLVPLLAEAALRLGSWRGAPAFLAVAAVFLFTAYLTKGKSGKFKGRPFDLRTMKSLVFDPAILGAGLGLVLAAGASMGSFSMLPLFLVFEHGFDQTTVNLLLPLSRVVSLGAALLAGILSDRLGALKSLGLVMTLSGIATMFMGQAQGTALVVLLFIQPALAVMAFPPVFTLISLTLDEETRHLGVALATIYGALFGAGVMPLIVGYLGEQGRFGLGFSLIGLANLMGPLVLYCLRERIHHGLKHGNRPGR